MLIQEVRITDDLDLLLRVMPAAIQEALSQEGDLTDLLEIVLDLGRRPEARFPDRGVEVTTSAVTSEDLQHLVERVGHFGKDNRAGIERTLHRISAIRNRTGDVVGLTCRVGRAVFGTIDVVRDVIEGGASTLLLGRPGVGKTTLLREAARVLADDLEKRVIVVDTSNEIAGDGDIPHPGIGRSRRMQVPSVSDQHGVMIEAVENHMPEVIVIDEIGTEAEALAARTIAERGVQLIATAHGNTFGNLLQNPTLSDLVGGIQTVTLGDDEARRRGTQKTVLERKAPPTFDVIIEIHDKYTFAVHHDVTEVVDGFLRDAPAEPELRMRHADGKVEIHPAKAPAKSPWDTAQGNGGSAPLPGPPRSAKERLRRNRRIKRIFPYAVSRNRLERAIGKLQVPAKLVHELREADLILTTKAQERRQPKRLRDAQMRGTPLYVVKSNTVSQLEKFLRSLYDLTSPREEETAALREVEDAIEQAMTQGRPIELPPRRSRLRRLQHELVEKTGLRSESQGDGPERRVIVQPS